MFLRTVVVLIAMLVLAICAVALPMGIATDKIGYYRPILLGLYVPAVPFFYALYQTLRLLNFIDRNTAFSSLSVHALGVIKRCAAVISLLFTAGLPYIYWAANKDDAPGVFALELVIIVASTIIAVFAAVLQQLLQKAIAIKAENDLTV